MSTPKVKLDLKDLKIKLELSLKDATEFKNQLVDEGIPYNFIAGRIMIAAEAEPKPNDNKITSDLIRDVITNLAENKVIFSEFGMPQTINKTLDIFAEHATAGKIAIAPKAIGEMSVV